MWSKIIAGLSFLFALLVGVIFRQKAQNKSLEISLENAEYSKDKEVTKVKLDQLDREQAAAIATAEVERNRKLSDKEMEDILNRL